MHKKVNGLGRFIEIEQDNDSTEVDLNQVVRLILSELGPIIAPLKAEISCDTLPVIQASWPQMKLLFENLILNALTFTRELPPKIQITVIENPEGWTFSITDNGIGIEVEYFPKLFVIFQRLHHRDHYDGVGMGLALCKKIVEKHKGRIWVESQLGKGSIFSFSLPTEGSPSST